MTKIDIISGFLGAGKTTLIKKLLQDAFKGQQVVLIENEFGEIGIDGGFLKDAGIEIREMNSGCICCSLVGDFGTALKEVAETYHPDRIIIEPSGVGKLSDVIHAVEKLDSDVVLNSAVTVVDVLKCKMYLRNFGEFFKNQVEAAGTVILSRTDLEKATPEKIEQAIALIRDLNPNATIITTPVETLEGKKILDTIEGVKIDLSQVEEEHEHDENCTCGCHDHDHDHDHHHHEHHDHDHHDHDHHDHDHDHHHHEHDHEHHEHDENCTCGCHDHDHDHHDHDHDHDHDHHHHHHADEVFSSWGRETVRKYSRDEIASILQALSDDESYGMVLRAKGMLEAEDGTWTYFDMVPGEADIRSGNPEYTGRICVIGSKMNEEKLEALWFQK
jgi:G3E family GTPase